MCILITVVDCGGRLFGVSLMSSNYRRISSVGCRMVRCYSCDTRYFTRLPMVRRGHAAVNNGRQRVRGLGSGAGGEAGERHDTASGVERGGVDASEPGRGARAVVHRRGGVFFWLPPRPGGKREGSGAGGRRGGR